MAEFESCNQCKYDGKVPTEEPCSNCIHNAMDNFKPKSNADRIRSMSDEELTEFLRKTVWEDGANLFDCADYTCEVPCAECPTYLKWLKSEAKE